MTEKVDSPETIWVGMRLRPLVEREKGQPHCLRIEGTEVHVVEEALDSERRMELHRASFAFDVAMDSTDPSKPEYISQEKCYEIMGGRMVQHMLQGFNTCLFCYGQTGTGKTTTIMGSAQPRRERGLLMRLVDDVFVEAGKQQDAGCQVHVVMQMLEVYNEKLNDLLAEAEPNPPSPNSLKKPIKIHVHPELGVYLTGATEAPVKNVEECIKTIEYGNTMKVVHATAMNAQSSRGHTICKLTVVKEGGKDNVTSNSEVYFADLAGRENERSTQVTGERFVELGFINKSLHHLSNCIRDLGQTEKRRKTICAEALRAKVAPGPNDMSKFRNSKLTLLLSNALSGNSRTSMIGTLSPASSNFEESHNTLKFASTVKTIKVQAKAAKALDKDALVRDLKNEILELRKQLEQAKEKHDDEALKEIADHLEASHAIVAAQTRDWVDFEEENAELSKKRARSFIRSSSHEMFPYLANHSEDPHLCFKLVMHVPEGKEQSLGSDISSDFRLPPALGVCETTGYIRNQGGCLTLRPAAAPSGRSGRFASIEVNGNKLSREQELHHLDCVLFGRSTSFYDFLQHASAEEVDERLRASRVDMEDWDGRITQPLVDKILGEARSKDPAEVKLAREYCDLLRGQNRDSEGELMLRAFMCQARRARVKVDEANELTRCVRPSSGLHFELAAQAPVLSYGFYRCANLPELCVRLVRRTRFRAAVRKVMAQLKKQNLIQAAVRSFLPAKSESISSDYQLLSTWTLPKFYARLEMMYEVRQNQLDDPSIKLEKLDKWKDPWAKCGVAEVEALQEAIFLTNILSSVASKKCPAALSSTMMNGSCMAFGYVMDILIFHKVPTKLTVIGAAMMLLAVMTMALTRLPRKSTRTENNLSTKEDTATPSSVASATSLASFVASEFAERQGPALALLPFLDFFNHRSAMRRDSIDWTCSFHERHGSMAMVADRFIAAGEELSFVYVSAPDAVLLVQYAMAPEVLGNLHNMAGVQVFPDDVGAVWEEKWRVLKQWGWNGHAPLLFTVPDALFPGAALRRLAELLAADT